MEEWKEVKLGDVVDLVIDYRGKTPLKLGGDWAASGYRALSAKNIKTRKIVNEESIRYVDEDLYKKWMKDEVQRGDILITSEAPFGQIYYWDSDEKIVLSQRLFCVRISDNVYSKFVYHYMTTDKFQAELDGRATGTTVVGLRQPELLKCIINLPTLPTQLKIANILSSLDDKIEVNRRINENLEAQAQALFKSWFVDFEPFKDGEFVESELGMIPKGWRVKRLEEVSKLIAGGDKPDVVSLNKTDDTPYAIYSNGIDNYGLYGFSDNYRIKEESVTVSARGTIGYVCLREEPYTPIVRLISVIPDTNFVSAKYMYHSLKIKPIQGTGTTQQQLTVPMFRNTLLVIPSQELMDSFTIKVNSMFELRRKNQQEITRLASLRDTLLPKLMSGEVDVNDVKI